MNKGGGIKKMVVEGEKGGLSTKEKDELEGVRACVCVCVRAFGEEDGGAGCWRKLLRPSPSPAVTNHFCSGSEGRRNVKIFE